MKWFNSIQFNSIQLIFSHTNKKYKPSKYSDNRYEIVIMSIGDHPKPTNGELINWSDPIIAGML